LIGRTKGVTLHPPTLCRKLIVLLPIKAGMLWPIMERRVPMVRLAGLPVAMLGLLLATPPALADGNRGGWGGGSWGGGSWSRGPGPGWGGGPGPGAWRGGPPGQLVQPQYGPSYRVPAYSMPPPLRYPPPPAYLAPPPMAYPPPVVVYPAYPTYPAYPGYYAPGGGLSLGLQLPLR
jgi:hypothetical protein